MSEQEAFLGGVDAQEHFLNNQVSLFLFDLKNEAREHGFKANESWKLELITENELISLKRYHHPVIYLRLQTQALLKVYQQVKNQLQQSLSEADEALTVNNLAQDEKKYLAAYPARTDRN